MTRPPYRVEVERVVITGARAAALDAAALRELVERAVAQETVRAPLPAGRAVRASVRVAAASLATPGALAGAVAAGVVRAMGGGGSHG
jgi:hypothetical protein